MIWDHDHIDNQELITMIHRARRHNHNDKLAVDTIVAHMTMVNTDLGWEGAAEVAGVDKEKLISKKRALVRDGVIEQSLPYPSSITSNEPSELLEYLERKNPDLIFDGTSPKTWALEAANSISWINRDLEEYPKGNRLLPLESVDIYYGERISRADGNLGRLLSQKRLTVEAIRRITYETSNRVRSRLEAIRNYGEYDLQYEDHDGKRWYWTIQ